jgi:sugar fermentation stimulation protein A
MGCCDAGNRVWLSESDRATRKYRHTWELVQVGDVLVGINTGLPNALVAEAIGDGTIRELAGYSSVAPGGHVRGGRRAASTSCSRADVASRATWR